MNRTVLSFILVFTLILSVSESKASGYDVNWMAKCMTHSSFNDCLNKISQDTAANFSCNYQEKDLLIEKLRRENRDLRTRLRTGRERIRDRVRARMRERFQRKKARLKAEFAQRTAILQEKLQCYRNYYHRRAGSNKPQTINVRVYGGMIYIQGNHRSYFPVEFTINLGQSKSIQIVGDSPSRRKTWVNVSYTRNGLMFDGATIQFRKKRWRRGETYKISTPRHSQSQASNVNIQIKSVRTSPRGPHCE